MLDNDARKHDASTRPDECAQKQAAPDPTPEDTRSLAEATRHTRTRIPGGNDHDRDRAP